MKQKQKQKQKQKHLIVDEETHEMAKTQAKAKGMYLSSYIKSLLEKDK